MRIFLGNQDPEEISSMLEAIPSWNEDFDGAIQKQTEMYAYSLQKIRYKDDYRGIISLIMNLKNHTETNISYAEMVKNWKLLRSYGEALTSSFPTLASSNP